MRPYEMMIILAPEIPEEELDPTIDTIETYITNLDGSVVAINQESPWGRRRLSYPIRYQGRDVRDGFYTLWYFDAEPASIVEIEREIRLNERIIRHLIIALDEQITLLPPEPQAAEGAEGGESGSESTDATPEGAEAPEAGTAQAADAAPETSAPAEAPAEASAAAEAAPAEAAAAGAETTVATADVPDTAEEAAPDDAEEAAPVEEGVEATKE